MGFFEPRRTRRFEPLLPRIQSAAQRFPGSFREGGAADKAASLAGCKSPRRQLPESDG